MNMRLAVIMWWPFYCEALKVQHEVSECVSVHPQEWHQKCSHYFILTASRGSCMNQALLTHPPGNVHLL